MVDTSEAFGLSATPLDLALAATIAAEQRGVGSKGPYILRGTILDGTGVR